MDTTENWQLRTSDTLSDVLSVACNSQKGITFISAKESFLSYRELYDQAEKVLSNLQKNGLRTGDHVVFQIYDEKNFLLTFWACVLGGMIPVPLSVGGQVFYKEKVLSCWQSFSAPYLIYDAGSLDDIIHFCKERGKDDMANEIILRAFDVVDLLESQADAKIPTILPDALCYIQFSSGSTGSAKGVMLTHENLVANITDIANRSAITSADAMLSWMPLTHDMGLICFHLTGILTSIDQYIMPTSLFVRRPLLWMEKANEHRISLLYSPNFGYHYLLSALGGTVQEWDLSSIRLIYNGAEPISHEVIHAFLQGLRPYGLKEGVMYPGYGMAEACVAVTLPIQGAGFKVYSLDRNSLSIGGKIAEVDAGESAHAVTFVSVGSPIDNCSIRICDDGDRVLNDDQVGHIQIKGKNTTGGYHNNPEANEKLFTYDMWLRTGDLGFIRDNVLTVTGRAKNVIILNGQNYYPQDIERSLLDIEGISVGNVVACGSGRTAGNGEQLIIFVLFRKGIEKFLPLAEEIEANILKKIGLVVGRVIPVRNIPKTSSGKIQNFLLLKEYHDGAYDEIINALERLTVNHHDDALSVTDKFLAVFHSVGFAGLKAVENFHEYGLNSLVTSQIIHKLFDVGIHNVSIKDFFEHTSIVDLVNLTEVAAERKVAEVAKVQNRMNYSLSPAQNRFWVLDRFSEVHNICNVGVAFLLQGTVDPKTLKNAFNLLIDRHESLRTVFEEKDSSPVQVIKSSDHFSFEIDIVSASQGQDLNDIMIRYIDQAFDLSSGPLFRGKIYQIGDSEYILCLAFHHIIIDGWSVSILLKELIELYGIVDDPEAKPLPMLKLQQRDYSETSAKRSLADLSASKSYWANELSTADAPIDLPFAKPRPALLTFNGESIIWEFSGKILEKIGSASKNYAATPFMILASALKILAYKYTGKRDIIIGTEAHGRIYPGASEQIGCYVNAVALRSSINEEDNFIAFLNSVKARILEAYEYQELSYDHVVDMVVEQPDPARSPLFDWLLLYQNFELEISDKDTGFHASFYPLPKSNALLDLQFEFVELSNKLILNLSYNTDLFEREDIRRFLVHFDTLLSNLLTAPERPVCEIEFVTSHERKLVEGLCQATERSNRDRMLPDLIEDIVKAYPHSTAVVDSDQGLFTYQELWEKTKGLAAILQTEFKVEQGDNIVLFNGRGANAIAAMLAIFKIGAVYVPIDPDYPQERICVILDSIDPVLILADEQVNIILQKIPNLTVPVVALSGVEAAQQGMFSAVDLNAPAYIIHTSGTTGKPKGVVISHLALVDYVLTFKEEFNVGRSDAVIHQSALAFDTFVEEIFPALVAGGTVIIAKNGGQDIRGLLDLVNQQKATILSTTPWVLNELNKYASEVMPLRMIISGGDTLRAAHVNHLFSKGIDIYNTYGPVETTVCATMHHLQSLDEAEVIGKPMPNHKVYIVNERMQQQPVGIPGEICISGYGLSNGYYKLPDLTSEKFINNPFTDEPRYRKLYKTGDMGRWLSNGTILFHGRNDSQVKVRGYRIEVGEVERTLLTKQDIVDAAVLPFENEKKETFLVAFYVTKSETIPDAVRSFLMDQVPVYMIPAVFIKLEKLPVNTHGKVDSHTLRQFFASYPSTEKLELPKDELEKQLLDIYHKTFDNKELGVEHNFFELGGNSLKAAVLTSEIKSAFGKEISLRNLFLHPTVRLLANHMSQLIAVQAPGIESIEQRESYSLSASQQRIWVLNHIDENPIAYNLSWAFEISGSLDVNAFEKAFNQLIQRHEVLRTAFKVEKDGLPKQLVLPVEVCSFNINYKDVRDTPYPTAEIDRLLNKKVNSPIDLDSWPLFHADILQVSDEQYIFSFLIHHILVDGWSVNIIAEELSVLYNAIILNTDINLPALKIQFKDYVAWESRRLETLEIQRQREFWLKTFKDGVPTLGLPTDFTRPRVQTFNGASSDFMIDAVVKDQLQKLSKTNGVSIFVLLLTAVKLLFFRYTGKHDIVLGVPVAGRNHQDVQPLLGLFLNTLPVRTIFNGQGSFREMVRDVNSSFMDAMEHQDYPFDALVEALRLPPDTSRSPLFDVMVGYQDIQQAHVSLDNLHGVEVAPYELDRSISQFDLSIDFFDVADGIKVTIEYNTNLFLKDRITFLSTHFVNILNEIVKNSDVAPGDIHLLTNEEAKLLHSFNPVAAAIQTGDNFVNRFENGCSKWEDQKALCFKNMEVSYRLLNSRSNQLAHFLNREFGIRKGQPVGVLMDKSVEAVVAILSTLKLGGIFVPLDPNAPTGRLNEIIIDSNVSFILTDTEEWVDKLPAKNQLVNVGNSRSLETEPDANPQIFLTGDDPAYMIYTSGSTGKPKGVLVKHKSLMAVTDAWEEAYQLTSEVPVLLQMANISFDVFIGDLCRSLLFGGTMVICPWEERLNPEALYLLMHGHRVNILESTGAMIFPLMGYIFDQKLDVSFLRLLIIGSDVCYNADFNRLVSHYGKQMRIVNSYGTTETTIDSSFFEGSEAISSTGVTPIGKPLKGTEFYILDDQQRLMPVGICGDLFIGGSGVAEGYVNRVQQTDDHFVVHPEYGRLYKTGDLGKWQLSGNLEFHGRNDTQIKIRGHRVELGEIENIILSLNDCVRKVCVTLHKNDLQEYLCAYYESEKPLDEFALKQKVKEHLPPHMQPQYYMHLHEFPLSANGKIVKDMLPAPETVGRISENPAFEPPANWVEQEMTLIWAEVLQVAEIGVNDNFFDHGGHSLKAFQIIIQTRNSIGCKINHIDIFMHPTIRELSAKIMADDSGKEEDEIQVLEDQDHFPVSNAQKRLWLIDQTNAESTAYHMPAMFKLYGETSYEALSKAFIAVLERHESLRTVFVMVNGELRQKITAPEYLGADIERYNPEFDPGEFFERSFDLVTGPLIRMAIQHKSQQEQVLLFNMHHIISDEWSTEILIREFTTFYNYFTRGEHPSHSSLPFNYRDYATWHNRRIDKPGGKQAERYWINRFLNKELVRSEIPGDFGHKEGEGSAGQVETFLGRSIAEGVKSVCSRQQVSAYMIFVTAVTALIYRYAGDKRVTIGSLLAGRSNPQLKDQIGFYVNTLLLYTEFDGTDTLLELLENVKNTILEAFEHGEYPYDELLGNLAVGKGEDVGSLFEVMVNLKNAVNEEKALNGMHGVEVVQHPMHLKNAKVDLIFNFTELDDNIHVSVDYNNMRYREESVNRFLDNLQALLVQIIDTPEIALYATQVPSTGERKYILDVCKGQDVTHNVQSFKTLFETQAAITPEVIAVQCSDDQLSYHELNVRANQLANFLREQYQVQSGDLIGLSVGRNVNILVGILGILKSGAAYVPIDAGYPKERKEFIINDSGVKLIISDEPHEGEPPCSILSLADGRIQTAGTENPQIRYSLDHAMYVIYTSGSTGVPKGVVVEHGAVMNLVHWLGYEIHKGEPQNAMLTASINFDASVQQLFTPLLLGGTLYISSEDSKRDPSLFVSDLIKHKINVLDITPSFLSILFDDMEQYKCRDLRYVLVGGEPLPIASIQKFYKIFTNTELINVYGTTETAVNSTYCTLRENQLAPGVIGKPISNTAVLIVDKHGRLAPVGAYGEVCIAGAGLGRGYLNRPELTAWKYVHIPLVNGNRLYKTGDIGRLNSLGQLELRGRNDRQVKIRGYRIELGEIEKCLSRHPDITDAFVQVYKSGEGDELVAYYRADQQCQPLALRTYLEEMLPDYMIPAYFMQLESIPLNSSGKLDVKALPDPYVVVGNIKNIIHAEDLRTAQFLAIVKEELKVQLLTESDNFFELGGHSLKAMKVASKVQKEMGLQLEVKHIFQLPVISKIVDLLPRLPKNSVSPILKVEDQDYFELSHAQKQLWVASFLEGKQNAYAITGSYEWTGVLCQGSLSGALAHVIQQHEVLRTRFITVDGHPRQQIIKPEDVRFCIDYSAVDDKGIADEIRRLLTEPFDLRKAPLLRLSVFSCSSDRHILVFRLHHIIGDEWSSEILLREILFAYRALRKGEANSSSPDAINYKDYAAYQNKRIQQNKMVEALTYWQSRFRSSSNRFEFPVDLTEVDKRSAGAGIIEARLDSPLSDELRKIGQNGNATPFMVFLTILKVVLYRSTGENEIIVGMPVANREHPATIDQIGFYTNTIPLKSLISGTLSFKDVLYEVRERVLEASKYQDFPFDLIVDVAGVTGVDRESPFFNVLAVYQDKRGGIAEHAPEGIKLKEYVVDGEAEAKYAWQFNFCHDDSGFIIKIEYHRALISDDLAQEALNYLLKCAEEVITGISIPIEDIEFLSDDTRSLESQDASFDFNF